MRAGTGAVNGEKGMRAGLFLPLLPGSHLLALVDANGKELDKVRFTVR